MANSEVRFGPLHAKPDGVYVGFPGAHCLQLTPDAFLVCAPDQPARAYDWDDLASVRIYVPTSRFRFIGAVAMLSTVGAGTVLMGDPGIAPKDGKVIVEHREGHTLRSPLTRHHIWGYWTRTVTSTEALLKHLIEVPESRVLLATPDAVVQAIARSSQ